MRNIHVLIMIFEADGEEKAKQYQSRDPEPSRLSETLNPRVFQASAPVLWASPT